jgi:hypothetical protein
MSPSTPDRDALLQRLSPADAAQCAPQGNDKIIWQGLTLHCTPFPSDALPPAHDALEACLLWQPAPGCPPALLVGAKPEDHLRSQALLQALAGQDQAWLYCGPFGAAGFCKRVFDGLFYLAGPALAQHASQAHGAAVQIDWVALLQQQQQLADKLAALCRLYLARHGICQLPQDSRHILDCFRQPPQQQTHYALSLATLLAVALASGEPARQLLDSLLASTRAGNRT